MHLWWNWRMSREFSMELATFSLARSKNVGAGILPIILSFYLLSYS